MYPVGVEDIKGTGEKSAATRKANSNLYKFAIYLKILHILNRAVRRILTNIIRVCKDCGYVLPIFGIIAGVAVHHVGDITRTQQDRLSSLKGQTQSSNHISG